MSERTTGRKLLDDLEKRVAELEGLRKRRVSLADIDRRLSEIEARLAETPANNPSRVAKA